MLPIEILCRFLFYDVKVKDSDFMPERMYPAPPIQTALIMAPMARTARQVATPSPSSRLDILNGVVLTQAMMKSTSAARAIRKPKIKKMVFNSQVIVKKRGG